MQLGGGAVFPLCSNPTFGTATIAQQGTGLCMLSARCCLTVDSVTACNLSREGRAESSFDAFLCRITALGLVPIGPAQCCKTCLSKTIHPLDSCSDLNFCSGHGVCNLGSCDCFDGYGGSDCGNVVSTLPFASLVCTSCDSATGDFSSSDWVSHLPSEW